MLWGFGCHQSVPDAPSLTLNPFCFGVFCLGGCFFFSGELIGALPASELVPGDLMYLRVGDKVSNDWAPSRWGLFPSLKMTFCFTCGGPSDACESRGYDSDGNCRTSGVIGTGGDGSFPPNSVQSFFCLIARWHRSYSPWPALEAPLSN